VQKGQVDEAIEHLRQAVALDPKYALAHAALGATLSNTGQLDEAIGHLRRAVALDPRLAMAHTNLGITLAKKGEFDEAIKHSRKAIGLHPKLAAAHKAMGLSLSFKGQTDEAIACFRQVILLDPKDGPTRYALGYNLLRTGRPAEAREATRGAQALLPKGHPLQPEVTRQLQTCERLLAVEPKLANILKGAVEPADTAERLALAELCRGRQLYARATRFYEDVFRADAKLLLMYRYRAACVSALAGCGRGKDDPLPGPEERQRQRRQALAWLRAELAALAKRADAAPGTGPGIVHHLQSWRWEPDLAGVRDEAALARLLEEERQAWQQHWEQAAALARRLDHQTTPVP
jgi:Tfp pilus assembly protein PilF